MLKDLNTYNLKYKSVFAF